MSDVDKQVASARADISRAQAAHARAQHEYQVAKAQAEAAGRDLKEEFGVSSQEEAQHLIDELEAELAAECKRVRMALSRAQTRGEENSSDR